MVELDGHQRGVWIPRVGHKQMNALTMASGKKQWRDRANNGDQASHAQRNNGEGQETMATLPFNRGEEWRKRETHNRRSEDRVRAVPVKRMACRPLGQGAQVFVNAI